MFGAKGPNSSQYDFKGTSLKPPPSSYKPTPSRAGGTSSGAAGRPQSNQGRGFSNKLTDKANELEGTKYRNALTNKANNNPEENFKKMEKEINVLLEECVNLKMSGPVPGRPREGQGSDQPGEESAKATGELQHGRPDKRGAVLRGGPQPCPVPGGGRDVPGGPHQIQRDHQGQAVQLRREDPGEHGQHLLPPAEVRGLNQDVQDGFGHPALHLQGNALQGESQHRPRLRQAGTVPGRHHPLRTDPQGLPRPQDRLQPHHLPLHNWRQNAHEGLLHQHDHQPRRGLR